MSDSQKQHYIPRSYLKNFAALENGSYYVYVEHNKEKIHKTNINNICAEKNLYTIDSIDSDKKNFIEEFYSKNIDSLFPEITQLVTNDKILNINAVHRKKIIAAILSLYFRTPKFLDYLESNQKRIITLAKNYILGKTENHIIDFEGKKIDSRSLDIDALENSLLSENKLILLQQHLEILNDFVNYKYMDGISINKIVDGSEFITSDNPVIISRIDGVISNLFDPENMIHIPIDNKYLLSIHPKNDTKLVNQLMRINGELMSVLIHNRLSEQNSERWIIGSEKSILAHKRDQEQYGKNTPENWKMVEDLEKKQNCLLSIKKLLIKQMGK